ncbi:MAG: hypothetical protein EHM36_12115 [Deltaproteobacteria bacterium]|nr:MAG: hypothetical protein EHM36_12115 [Deltaproteobacteria bacterium]
MNDGEIFDKAHSGVRNTIRFRDFFFDFLLPLGYQGSYLSAFNIAEKKGLIGADGSHGMVYYISKGSQ